MIWLPPQLASERPEVRIFSYIVFIVQGFEVLD